MSFSQNTDTNIVEFENSLFFHITNKDNDKLIVYLHGGLSNPYFKENQNEVELNELLENNNEFINYTTANNFDVLLPVTNDDLNWITDPERCFITFKKFLDQNDKKYSKTFISGFSDGGTGSYKIFYSSPEYFSGLIVFNGYPYHRNFAVDVDYTTVQDKKIMFFGTKKDKVIHYEFMLTEYCKQKTTNPDTYIYLTEGGHSFEHYGKKEFAILFDILSAENDNTKMTPIHGYIRKDSLITFYEFRKEIVRKYGFGAEYYKINKEQKARYKGK